MCIFTVDISFIYRSLKILEFGLILYEILAKKGLIAAQTFGCKRVNFCIDLGIRLN